MHDRRRPEFRSLRQPALAAALLLLLAATAGGTAGCGRGERPLQPRDLTTPERLYVERFVVLERARALALADSLRGAAVLDSLAAAWEDSSLPRLADELPRSPRRMAALHDLLGRLLAAERESLLVAPDRRLSAPLPPSAPRLSGP